MPKRKLSEQKFSIVGDTNSNHTVVDPNAKCWLQLLPNEVIELIYNFLTPRCLIAIESLKCGRISDLTRIARRRADFSSCNYILPAEMKQFFAADSYIREINFSHIFLVNTSDLVKSILRCKQLTSLTVIECGVEFHHIKHILGRCEHLQELHWNVMGKSVDVDYSQEVKIEKLYLHIDSPKSSEIAFHILRCCPSISEACFNFTSMMTPHLPLKNCHTTIVYQLHSYCPVHIILNDYFQNLESVYKCIMATKWCGCPNAVGSLSLPIRNPYLQMVVSNEMYPSLTEIPNKSVQRLVLHFANKISLFRKMEDVKILMGNNLKVVKAIEFPMDQLPMENSFFDLVSDTAEEDRILMNELVNSLISSCCSIQVLILSSVHFNREPLKFEALYCLRGLRTLRLPSCAFRYDQKTSQQPSFEELVKTINNVEDFSITSCGNPCSYNGPKDKDISAISQWKRLKTLSLLNVKNLQFYHFLRDIAVNCPTFKSLEIMTSHFQVVHHYIPNVMVLLEKSPQLVQLCMNVDVLCIKSIRFWNSLSCAKNLQCLCLTLTQLSVIQSKCVADVIKELPLLHIFHFNTPCIINEGLSVRVTREMKRNGVKYPQVEMATLSSFSSNSINCYSPHLYNP